MANRQEKLVILPKTQPWTDLLNKLLDIETDGDSWHLQRNRVKSDNQRNNGLEALGWHVLRFNTQQISEQRTEYCIPEIQKMIDRLDGLIEDGIVPRRIYPNTDGVQQLSLFENKADYTIDNELDFD